MTTDGDLVRLVQQGNLAAWESVVQQYQEPVFRLAYLLLGDADDAEDIAQETFIRAYRAIHRFDLGRPIRPWLLRITTNLTKNWRRGVGRYLFALKRLLNNEAPILTPQQQAEQNLETLITWEAVRKLSLADQQIIHLRYFLECSENETADVLEIPIGTVKSRLHRALTRLRIILEEQDPELAHEEE